MDASPKGPKDFNLVCGLDGSFNVTKDLGCSKVLCGTCPSGDKYKNSKVVEKGKRYYGDQCHYTCDKGYTLDSEPTGDDDFTLSCLAGGEFSEPKTCTPVSCGPPEPVLNAETLTKEVVVYPNSATYRVNEGYTLTGKVESGQEFTRKCQANGKYTGIIPPRQKKSLSDGPDGPELDLLKPTIDPVPCGEPPKVDNSMKYKESPQYYLESVKYTCHNGYTVTGKADGDTTATIVCGAQGKYLYNDKSRPMPKCLPVECGDVPAKDNAKQMTKLKTSVVTAASPALVYQCDADIRLTKLTTHTPQTTTKPQFHVKERVSLQI
jgi:hypothetical protein